MSELVWDYDKQQFIPLRAWMRWCMYYNTRYVSEAVWNRLLKERK